MTDLMSRFTKAMDGKWRVVLVEKGADGRTVVRY
jgi:hypothetical protein